MSWLNRIINRRKNTSQIDQEIAQRQAQGRPVKQLQDELDARQTGTLDVEHDGFGGSRQVGQSLHEQKAQIKAVGGWTGPVNRALNRTKSTDSIRAEIAQRQAQGRPTRQLEDELYTR